MFTEQSLRDHPSLVKAFMGLEPEQYWELVETLTTQMDDYLRQQRTRPQRQRQVGAGRHHAYPLSIRIALVLSYLRLHIPQHAVALLFGATQPDVSRELVRLLPLIGRALPCPAVWDVQDGEQDCPKHVTPAKAQLSLEQVSEQRVLVDATEQRVSRPSESVRRKTYYSGKKKAFTLKTQIAADGGHHVHAISVAVGGAEHDKALSDRLDTLAHVPDGCEVDADKGYQGLAAQVELVTVTDATTGHSTSCPRLVVKTPFKKPKGGELTDGQKAFNRALGAIRIRVEHCLGWAKNWAILATRFRCSHTRYTSIMRIVFGLVNAQTKRWRTARANCA